jgi:hypothetical protein
MRSWAILAISSAIALGGSFSKDALAQSPGSPEPGRFELALGPQWTGPTSYASRDATLTTATGGSFRLFSTSSELGASPGFELRFGARVARLVQAEIVGSYATPDLRTTITNDVEASGSTTAFEPIQEFIIEAAAVVNLARWRPSPRVVPFVSAGVGYVRQLHDDRTLVQTGQMYHVGGGAKFQLVSRGEGRRLKQIGVRAEARALVRTGGITLDDRAHTAPAISAALFVRF